MPGCKNEVFGEIDEPATFCVNRRAICGHLCDCFSHLSVLFQFFSKEFRVSSADDIPVSIRQAVMNGAEKNRFCTLCTEDIEEIVVVKIERFVKGNADFDIRCFSRTKQRGLFCGCRRFLCEIKKLIKIEMIPDYLRNCMDFFQENLFL